MRIELIAKTVLTDAGRRIAASGRPDQGQGSDAEALAEIAGRVCYDSWGQGRSSHDFHQHIITVGHGSVWEHPNWTFLVEGVSRNLSLELVRHHIGRGVSQRSTRYCDESDATAVLHPLTEQWLAKEAGAVASFNFLEELASIEGQIQRLYADLVGRLQAMLVDRGVDKLTARKQARAAAARHLPGGMATELVWTMNGRAFRNVVEQRDNPGADGEIRKLAHGFYELGSTDSPWLFEDYSPGPPNPDGMGDGLVTAHRKI